MLAGSNDLGLLAEVIVSCAANDHRRLLRHLPGDPVRRPHRLGGHNRPAARAWPGSLFSPQGRVPGP